MKERQEIIDRIFELVKMLQDDYANAKEREYATDGQIIQEYYAGKCDGISNCIGYLLDWNTELIDEDIDDFCA